MQNKHSGSMRSHDCYQKRCVKNSLTKYSFHVMESSVSSNCTRNIHWPSTAEKEVNRKENTVPVKDCQEAIESKIYACSDIDLGEVLFHNVMFCDKENRFLSSKIYRVSLGGIS